jgi:hypothetical protein
LQTKVSRLQKLGSTSTIDTCKAIADPVLKHRLALKPGLDVHALSGKPLFIIQKWITQCEKNSVLSRESLRCPTSSFDLGVAAMHAPPLSAPSKQCASSKWFTKPKRFAPACTVQVASYNKEIKVTAVVQRPHFAHQNLPVPFLCDDFYVCNAATPIYLKFKKQRGLL